MNPRILTKITKDILPLALSLVLAGGLLLSFSDAALAQAPELNIPDPIVSGVREITNPQDDFNNKTYKIPASDPDGDTLTYSVQNLPQRQTTNDTVFFTETGILTWTVSHADLDGNDSVTFNNVTFTVSDGAHQASQTVTISLREAKTYYVDESAPDGGDGSQVNPWNLLADAQANVQEGDVVLLRGGDYGTFTESTRGGDKNQYFTRTDWITYKAAPGHRPILNDIYVYNAYIWGGKLNGQSYLVFDGFQIDDGAMFQYIGG